MYKTLMQLSDYMQAYNLTDKELAAKIGKHRVSISRYRRGLETPSPEVIKKLVELSGGIITANELLGIEQSA
jgi:transcriptional regulator with XRE-family HTH domain